MSTQQKGAVMLEILFLFFLGKRLARIVRGKGRQSGGYVALLVALWFAGEIGGLVLGAVATSATSSDGEPNGAVMLLGAVFGAALGATTVFLIANSLPPIERDHWHSEKLDDFGEHHYRRRWQPPVEPPDQFYDPNAPRTKPPPPDAFEKRVP
jgi:hypothetical protein